MASYIVLGDHGPYARVRFFLDDGSVVDENVPMPAPITIEQQLMERVKARIDEIQSGTKTASTVVSANPDTAAIGHVDVLPQLADAVVTAEVNLAVLEQQIAILTPPDLSAAANEVAV